jgi:cytochrome c-type biogenesis protein CcmH/NrfG
MLAAARPHGKTFSLGVRARAALLVATVALAAAACVGLVGTQALAASEDAQDNGQLAKAEAKARTAARWSPWSAAGWERLAEVRFAQNDLNGARAALLEALERDPADWALWYDLGVASEGRERLHAYREAARLNPLSRNVSVLRSLRILPPLSKEERP